MLHNLFNAISLRERVLLAAFVWVLLLLWFSSLWGNVRSERVTYRIQQNRLEDHNRTLAQASDAERELERARAGLDPRRTFTASQLSERLDGIARETGVSFTITSPSTQESDIFNYHSVRVAIRQARIENLIQFDERLKRESPYISLGSFQITANTRDPRILDATFELSSFELKDAAIN